MAITADHISTTLATYLDRFPEDRAGLAVPLGLLADEADVTSRREFRGHFTAGAVLVNHKREALLINHRTLDKWLTPGGHLEPEDTTLLGAALRELTEETGVSATGLASVGPIHIDVHAIPKNPAKGEPGHLHIDVRFLFKASGTDLVTLQEEEVTGYAWRPVEGIADETLRTRVLAAL
ncbi:NUDIX hydrolase [Kitasatospora griseola]|uniref:NUDIX hydrolase n=1 Tax=Kitasatospora griseola TaxID=2064 RepID=A0A0D0NEN1_KITGR|nr:NUDIX hydrolase [Kitasatospora griseola]KIQ66690.1 NUDIX hydrolase [Kitasatospora griseola]